METLQHPAFEVRNTGYTFEPANHISFYSTRKLLINIRRFLIIYQHYFILIIRITRKKILLCTNKYHFERRCILPSVGPVLAFLTIYYLDYYQVYVGTWYVRLLPDSEQNANRHACDGCPSKAIALLFLLGGKIGMEFGFSLHFPTHREICAPRWMIRPSSLTVTDVDVDFYQENHLFAC